MSLQADPLTSQKRSVDREMGRPALNAHLTLRRWTWFGRLENPTQLANLFFTTAAAAPAAPLPAVDLASPCPYASILGLTSPPLPYDALGLIARSAAPAPPLD